MYRLPISVCPAKTATSSCDRLRARHGVNLPAVALTAYARATDRERALAAGFQRYVVKPVDPSHLVAVIASLC